jgi:hypothetical protein
MPELLVFYNQSIGSYNGAGQFVSLPSGYSKNQFQEQLYLRYTLHQRFDLAVQFSYFETSATQGNMKAYSTEPGDTLLLLRYAMTEEYPVPLWTGIFQLKVPTGKYEHGDASLLSTDLTGNGSWDIGAGAVASVKMKPAILHADLVYNQPLPVVIDTVNTTYGGYLNYDLAWEYFVDYGFNLEVEFNGVYQAAGSPTVNSPDGSESNLIILSPGLGWSNRTIQTMIGYALPILGLNASAQTSAVFCFRYDFN